MYFLGIVLKGKHVHVLVIGVSRGLFSKQINIVFSTLYHAARRKVDSICLNCPSLMMILALSEPMNSVNLKHPMKTVTIDKFKRTYYTDPAVKTYTKFVRTKVQRSASKAIMNL